MKGENLRRIGLLLYASVSTYLFVYELPLIYVGFGPVQPKSSIQVTHRTVLDVMEQGTVANVVKLNVWFAQKRTVRFWGSIVAIILMVIAQFTLRKPNWRETIYQTIMWLALGVFVVNYIGLICILVVV
jgi:hypothetical protein